MQHLLVVLVLATTAASQAVETSKDGSPGDDDFKVKVMAELMTLKSKVALLEAKNDKLRSTVSSLESKVAMLETKNDKLQSKIKQGTSLNRQKKAMTEQEVGFSATISGHLKNLSHDQPIVFGTVISNYGQAYNGNSGVFYVPVSGTYMFFVNILSENDNSIETELLLDGKVIAEIYSGATRFFGAGSNFVIVTVKRGQNVWVKVHNAISTNMAIHCCWSTFSGYLLREDTELDEIVG